MADFVAQKSLVWTYLDVLDSLAETTKVQKSYPLFTFPSSSLPDSKNNLKKALTQALERARVTGNDFQQLRLERGLWYLDRFTP